MRLTKRLFPVHERSQIFVKYLIEQVKDLQRPALRWQKQVDSERQSTYVHTLL